MSRKVMIVDDSQSMRVLVDMTLSIKGYTVLQASDGEDALKKLEGLRVHLIICDLHMPRINGIEFLHAIRKHPDNRFTPVIMLTTEHSQQRRDDARAAGAKAWIVKPFSPPELLDAVNKLIAA